MYGFPYTLPWFVPNIGYGANVNSKSLAGMNSISSTATMDLLARQILVSQSRQLSISNGVAAAAIDRYVTGVVGQGITYVPPETSSFIGDLYPILAPAMANRLSVASQCCELDGQHEMTFPQLQTLVIENMLLSGEVFLVRKPGSFAWTAIEADRCINPYYMCANVQEHMVGGVFKLINVETGNRIVDGVEIDNTGHEVAYWILKEAIERPLAMTPDQIERIPAEDSDTGLPICLHVYRPVRPSCWRGAPLLAPVIEQLYLMSAYLQSEQDAAALQASLYGFMVSEKPTVDETSPELPSRMDELVPIVDDSEGGDDDEEESTHKPYDGTHDGSHDDTDEEPVETNPFSVSYKGQDAIDEVYRPRSKPMTSGTFTHLKPGEDVKFLQSTHPNQNFAPFWAATTEIIASAVGLPAEVLKLSFNSSYSASRAALLQANEKYCQVRSHFLQKFIRPVIKCFVYETLEGSGMSDDDRLFISTSMATEAEFRVPRMPCIDQRQELEAYKLALEMGLLTRDDIAMMMYNKKAPETPDKALEPLDEVRNV